eukprot:TRINITY_DN89778_c0_g1_i1.p1 TRINITY_DN89778_c0_g1~~TRINITY_DN89778_c0_g1_i1.p1  ORF type:complete len:304 (-),score=5.52 TRINITY_DN89778_c0_g1_i1:151-1062(-)
MTMLMPEGSSKTQAILLATVISCFLLPLPMKLLSYGSAASNFGQVLSLAMLGISAYMLPQSSQESIGFINDISAVPMMIGVINFSYVGHACYPNFYSAMKEPSRFSTPLGIAFAFALFVALAVGLIGIAQYGPAMESQYTKNLGRDLNGDIIPGLEWFPFIGGLCFVMKLISTFPLLCAPVINSFEISMGLVETGKKSSEEGENASKTVGRLVFRLVFVFILCAIAILVRDYAMSVQGIVGYVFGSSCCLIYPCVFYWRLYGHQTGPFVKFLLVLILAWAAFVMFAGTGYCIWEMTQGNEVAS